MEQQLDDDDCYFFGEHKIVEDVPGLSYDQIVGKTTIRELGFKADLDQWEKAFEESISSGKESTFSVTAIMPSGGERFTDLLYPSPLCSNDTCCAKLLLVVVNTHTRYLHHTIQYLGQSAHDRPVYLNISWDDTERYSTTKELERKKQHLQATIEECQMWKLFFDNAPIIMVVVGMLMQSCCFCYRALSQ